jgi:hypothetical protein
VALYSTKPERVKDKSIRPAQSGFSCCGFLPAVGFRRSPGLFCLLITQQILTGLSPDFMMVGHGKDQLLHARAEPKGIAVRCILQE